MGALTDVRPPHPYYIWWRCSVPPCSHSTKPDPSKKNKAKNWCGAPLHSLTSQTIMQGIAKHFWQIFMASHKAAFVGKTHCQNKNSLDLKEILSYIPSCILLQLRRFSYQLRSKCNSQSRNLRQIWSFLRPRVDPTKLCFFANKEFLHFSLVSLHFCYIQKKFIDSKMT